VQPRLQALQTGSAMQQDMSKCRTRADARDGHMLLGATACTCLTNNRSCHAMQIAWLLSVLCLAEAVDLGKTQDKQQLHTA